MVPGLEWRPALPHETATVGSTVGEEAGVSSACAETTDGVASWAAIREEVNSKEDDNGQCGNHENVKPKPKFSLLPSNRGVIQFQRGHFSWSLSFHCLNRVTRDRYCAALELLVLNFEQRINLVVARIPSTAHLMERRSSSQR